MQALNMMMIVVLITLATLARAYELSECSTSDMKTLELVTDESDEGHSVTLNGELCDDPDRACKKQTTVKCANVTAPEGGYYNAHTFYVDYTEEYAEAKNITSDTDTSEGRRLYTSSTGSILAYATTYYYKLPYGVDASNCSDANNLYCKMFYPNYDGLTIAQRACDAAGSACEGYGIYEPWQQNPFYCLKKKLNATSYNSEKQSRYPAKLFKRYSGSSLTAFYGFLSLDTSLMPSKTSVLRSFSPSALYSENDCKSMCEIDDDCNGYSMNSTSGYCSSLYTSTSTSGGVTNNDTSISYYRQSKSATDSFSDCELDSSKCPSTGMSSGNLAATIVLSVAGAFTILGVGFFIHRRRQRARATSDSQELGVSTSLKVGETA